ncbi:hypothetical protein A3D77_06010 [Candidatus Gottesmanbacteria bacterium RIFCSPHIGHO2_02_FULL_39_11]|uniref:NIF system FeS cluster assembly NifU N-terminal domain-containing protein n=1 Tax=Candidatus Gottesmanbacteria bacterium RIFCSPHIGHO2_02_FULL_39_11 TaxID=1798382 RepID=A0A1F5ZWW1_9BACT|nr:MAG: hypothetical protein A3D77_06010 [Candidatus Gottesmanbacteria bacterium RIFCSPHIGHO2_02_FULL_39_11]
MDSLYRDYILDHYRHPQNFGTLENPDGASEEVNELCGDRIKMQIKFRISNFEFRIKDVKFYGEGCAIMIASASMLTEKVKGLKEDEIMKLNTDSVLEILGIELTPNRIKCAVLPLEALQKSLILAKKKRK